jgi:lipopolysaccharide export LptBFGC system permease protein LptF
VLLFRYLLRAVLVRLALALPALAVVYLAFDLGDQGRRLASEVGWGAVLRASLLHLPLVTVQILPAALLLAAVLAVGALRRRGELQAMALAGAGPLRLGAPLLVAGALCAACALLLDEVTVPPCERAADRLYRGRRASALTGLDRPGSWARQREWLLHRRDDGQLLALAVGSRFEARQRVEGQLTADGQLHDARGERFVPGGSFLPMSRPTLPPLPAELWSSPRAEARRYLELRHALHALREAGQARTAEELVLHTKLAFPLINVVVALLAWPFALGHRQRSPVLELLAALGLLFGLWAALAGGWLAGRAGWLPPGVAVWAPTLLGAALASGFVLRRARR